MEEEKTQHETDSPEKETLHENEEEIPSVVFLFVVVQWIPRVTHHSVMEPLFTEKECRHFDRYGVEIDVLFQGLPKSNSNFKLICAPTLNPGFFLVSRIRDT